MNAKLLCRRIGRAIFELDQASWSVGNDKATKATIETARLSLYQILSSNGYEFAKTDSPAVRRVRERTASS